MQTTPISFVDCETTHLDPDIGRAWEIAVIRRDTNGTETEHLWQIRLNADDLALADPKSLAIGRYHERRADIPDGYAAADMLAPDGPRCLKDGELEDALDRVLTKAVVVGSNPGFDLGFLRVELGTEAANEPWHYRPVDVATLAAGYRHAVATSARWNPRLPYSSRALSQAVGVEPPGPDDAHTALADARWARDVWDAVMGGPR